MTETPGPPMASGGRQHERSPGRDSAPNGEGTSTAPVTFTLPQPVSVNKKFIPGTYALTGEWRAWQDEAGWEIIRHGPARMVHLGKRVRITYEFGKTRKDLDNMMKAIADLLKQCSVILDDRPKIVRGYSVDLCEDDVKPGCVRVKVAPA